jgi:hypothetical protein
MPGVGMHCLNTIQPIFGCDLHRAIPPLVPPPPMSPHVIVWTEGLSETAKLPITPATSKAERGSNVNSSCGGRPVVSGWGFALARGHDAGPWVAHIWPNALLPVILLAASNKAEFAANTVRVPDGAGTGGMAVAVAYAVNFQLDCWDFPFPSMPSSVAVAVLNPVYAGFTLADFLGGLAAMAVDMAFAWAVNGILGLGAGALGNAMSKGLTGLTNGLLKSTFNSARGHFSFMPYAAKWFTTEAKQMLAQPSVFVPAVVGNTLQVITGVTVGNQLPAVNDLIAPPSVPAP